MYRSPDHVARAIADIRAYDLIVLVQDACCRDHDHSACLLASLESRRRTSRASCCSWARSAFTVLLYRAAQHSPTSSAMKPTSDRYGTMWTWSVYRRGLAQHA